MPLQLPNLDNRGYNDLVAEAVTLIPTYSPDWTNYNPSDPGITLVELFAYLTDMLLYRLNRITDDNTRKFLQLLNGPDWIEPPGADLRDEVREAVLRIRERYRAVTADDYEFLATESFNQWLRDSSQSSINLVSRAHTAPQRNLEAGSEAERLMLRPEHVSVVIVPSPDRAGGPGGGAPSSPNPQPGANLIAALFSYLDERRMLTTKLHVTGPFYVHVSAQLVVARNADALDGDVAAAINASLASLLNPLPSPTGGGWPFGRDVFVSQVYETLENIPGIDFITDVMLGSSCAPGDGHCVIADPIWHAEGDLIGLTIQEHHLPVFDAASIVIAPNSAFISVKMSVSAKAAPTADWSIVKRAIKSTVRGALHPSLGGPDPASAQPTDIFVADLQVAVKNTAGVLGPVTLAVDCVPSGALQQDPDRGAFIHVPAGGVLDWTVAIQLS